MTRKNDGKKGQTRIGQPIKVVNDQKIAKTNLTKLEKQARREAAQSIRMASCAGIFSGSAAGYGGVGGSGYGNILSADSNFYSPQLSTDFLELPQSEREKRELFRFWYTCWVPGAPVVTWDGTTVPIEDVRVGDKIPNGFGNITEVVETFKHDIKDNIISMRVRGIQSEIQATGNHPFYTLRAEKVDCKYPSSTWACRRGKNSLCQRTKCEGQNFGTPEYVYAKDLKIGDYIVSPWLGDTKDCGLSRAELRLLGYYASEGSLSYRSAGVIRGVEFSLSIDESQTIAIEISSLYEEAFKKKARIYTDPSRNTTRVICDGVGFARFCEKYVGRGSHEKRLHEDIIHANPEQMLEFLGTYWNGDGCFTDNSYTADTMSEDLASQVFHMLRRLQIPAYNAKYYRPERVTGGRIFPAGTVHYVSFPGRYFDVFSKYANWVDGKYSVDSTRVYIIHTKEGFLHRIESLNVIQYEGSVFNFEVKGEGDQKSYIAHSLATHNTHPIVGAAIDFHTDVPMSKIHLSLPKGADNKRNKQILHFYEQMCKKVRLFQVLYDATHEYWLHGNAFLFCEDHDMTHEIPEDIIADVKQEEVGEIDYAGRPIKKTEITKNDKPIEEAFKNIKKYVQEHYKGWQRIQILPPEQIKLEVFQYTNRTTMQLIPSEKDRLVVLRSQQQSDPEADRIAEDIPEQIKENLLNGQPIPLNTSPYDDFLCSSFCHHLAHKKSAYDDRGISILERCHLPGTEIIAKRDGLICQIPIEELDPEIDEVLGGSGKWRKFDWGTRPVNEEVCSVNVYKTGHLINMTQDHIVPVLRGNEILEVPAKNIFSGDYVQMVSVPLMETYKLVDLKNFIQNLGDQEYIARKTGAAVSMSVEVIDETESDIVVKYSKKETDPRKVGYYAKLQNVYDWILSLPVECQITRQEFCDKFKFHPTDFKKIRTNLADRGAIITSKREGSETIFIFTPIPDQIVVNEDRNITRICKKELVLDGNSGYLIGYFLGDGWVKINGNTADYGQFGICYNSKSARSCASAKHLELILDKLGIKWSETEHTVPSSMRNIYGYDDIFTRWSALNFGHTKEDKHLPSWIWNAPKEFLFGILRGIYDSDGAVSVKKTGVVTVQLAMSTKQLVDQLQILMLSLGLPVSRHFHKSRNTKMPNGSITMECRPLYQLALSDRPSVRQIFESGFMAKAIDVELEFNSGWGVKHLVHDGKLFFKVRKNTLIPYGGPVYSLNVEEDHKFYSCSVLLNNCLRTLIYQDKLRQAQTSIASRAMTPKRVVWADKMSEMDVEDLRNQVDQALIDPDFTIVTNFEVHWDEIGARDRLLDLATEYEITNKLLYIGLRITESMLTGESTYSGERIHLDVMNTMYLLYRETVATLVEDNLFAPVAEKKGFFEIDEFDNKVLLYPKLKFTRLALRDNSELQDFMFNLYQKGSLPISYIYELINVDPHDASAELRRDLFTPRDSTYNELVRALLTAVGDKLGSDSNIAKKIADDLGLELKEEGDRFGSESGK